MLSQTRNRIQSIDVLRGLIMIIMVLDHVRDFFYKVDLHGNGTVATGPTDLATTYPALFFTRWITHFCAPTFVFLAGVSAYLMGLKKTTSQLSASLLKRGIVLVIMEVSVITLAWTFNPFFNIFILQVIWAIGISMIILALVIWLPYRVIVALGILLIAGLNTLNFPSISHELKQNETAEFTYYANFYAAHIWGSHFAVVVYSFLPWTGIMMLGYGFGKIYAPTFDALQRRKLLLRTGTALLIAFVVLRLFINRYGDPAPWSVQSRGPVYTFLSFLNVTKYPPSLMFCCVTLGVAMLMLAWLERVQNRLTDILNIYGRVPMLFYILHFYVIHTLVLIGFYISGFGSKDIVTPNSPFWFRPSAFGVPLWGVYAVWIFVVFVLYPICRKYDRFKSANRRWWTGYL